MQAVISSIIVLLIILSGKLSREERMVACIGDIISELVVAHREGKDVNLNKLKTRLSSVHGLETSPRLVDIIAAVPLEHKKSLVPKLKAKPVRTASGVIFFSTFTLNNGHIMGFFQIAVVAVMCKPHRCPHISMTGNICVYCPGGPDSDFEYSTQSYTGYEPTSMRAIRARYNPYLQTKHRTDQVSFVVVFFHWCLGLKMSCKRFGFMSASSSSPTVLIDFQQKFKFTFESFPIFWGTFGNSSLIKSKSGVVWHAVIWFGKWKSFFLETLLCLKLHSSLAIFEYFVVGWDEVLWAVIIADVKFSTLPQF